MSNYSHDDQSNVPQHTEEMGPDAHHHLARKRLGLSSGGAIWFFLIVVALFIAAVNFVKVMSREEGHTSEAHAPTHGETGVPAQQPMNQTIVDSAIHNDDAQMKNAADADSVVEALENTPATH